MTAEQLQRLDEIVEEVGFIQRARLKWLTRRI